MSSNAALFQSIHNELLQMVLNCDCCDFDKTREAIIKLYTGAKLKPPSKFYLFNSPFEALCATETSDILKKERILIHDLIAPKLLKGVYQTPVFEKPTLGQITFLDFVVKEQLRLNILHSFKFQLNHKKLTTYATDHLWGSHSSTAKLFEIEYAIEKGYDVNTSAKSYLNLAKCCGWWFPYKNIAILQHRHKETHFDNEHRLHNETGPSVVYRDGFEVYAWHGTWVPNDWIKYKNDIDPETILTYTNIERRRAGCEILGWAKILTKLPTKIIDKNPDPEIGTLLEVKFKPENNWDDGKARFIKVKCGTGREFALPVPLHMTTAAEAVARTYGLDSAMYQPEVRT